MKSGKATSQTNTRRPIGGSRSASCVEAADDRNWRLPSGATLADFAFQSGFLAPSLLRRPLPPASTGSLETVDGQSQQSALLTLDRWLRKDYR